MAEQIRQDLVCRSAAEVDEPITVADVAVNAAQAWRLVEDIHELHSSEQRDTWAQGDWLTEGF